MNLIKKALTFTDKSLTDLHLKWWDFQNKVKKYEVEPYSPRYWWTRQELVTEICNLTLAHPDQWENYIRQTHFQFYDERIVEYSWAISRIASLGKRDRFLDVGCVMNTGYCLEKLLSQFSDIHFLNLVSEPLARQGRISYHSQDIRRCVLPQQYFDCITCISTLEHVGGDNHYNDFSVNGSAEIGDFNQAIPWEERSACWQEAFEPLINLLKPDGLLLVSMPYGGGLWNKEKGEYQIGEEDIKQFYQIASQHNRHLNTMIMQKDENGWQKHNGLPISISAKNLPPAGANVVVLIEVQ